MKNDHLIPVNIIDLAHKLNDSSLRRNERDNYELRLEAIRDYCTSVLNTYSRDKSSFLDKETRAKLSYSRVGKNNI